MSCMTWHDIAKNCRACHSLTWHSTLPNNTSHLLHQYYLNPDIKLFGSLCIPGVHFLRPCIHVSYVIGPLEDVPGWRYLSKSHNLFHLRHLSVWYQLLGWIYFNKLQANMCLTDIIYNLYKTHMDMYVSQIRHPLQCAHLFTRCSQKLCFIQFWVW